VASFSSNSVKIDATALTASARSYASGAEALGAIKGLARLSFRRTMPCTIESVKECAARISQ